MVNLDKLKKTVEVVYKDKTYHLEKIKEKEKDLFEKINQALQENDMSVFDEVMDFLVDRFKKADSDFPEKLFREEATFEMVLVVFQALGISEKKINS